MLKIAKGKTKKSVGMGQLFRLIPKTSGYWGVFILTQTAVNMVALVSLGTGNRWHDPIQVKYPSNLSTKEIKAVFSSCDASRHFVPYNKKLKF